eukprot:CAMPEP_0171785066 /NCGR_PEP_ID=MMETSP0991-20121206/62467_1 /TAXON_ID=483369 /ORGANISM="non described non described, Strain CCMP2098" /LENGTH=82 /DNA_ID=CAMNT_0012393523 /DNA_START=194 /DNA_END=439 /DNA_ORIENTATION=+
MSDRVPMNCYGTRNAPRHDKPFAGRVDDSAAFEVGVAVESDLHRALRAIGVEFDAQRSLISWHSAGAKQASKLDTSSAPISS